jgi:predicted glycosyltransferase
MKKRLLFYCQPVLGMGHLVRSLAVLRGLDGFEIGFINGGLPLAAATVATLPGNIAIINLPALQADPEFRGIVAIDPTRNLDEIRAERMSGLLEIFATFNPDILMIELFPFGRMKFDFELRPLLEAARRREPAPSIVCSLRDILVAKRDQKDFEDFAIERANQFFDLILVHSDPTFQPLGETFPPVDRLTCRIEYTGYVVEVEPAASNPTSGDQTVVVSIGGGRVGLELLYAASEASRQVRRSIPHRLHLFTGPYLPADEFRKLVDNYAGDDDIVIERFTPDLVGAMRNARLSISLAGYNTCMNILTAGVPSIVHPFTGNENREQTIRAHKLEQSGIVSVITAEELASGKLAPLMAAMLTTPANSDHRLKIDLDGVRKTKILLTELAGETNLPEKNLPSGSLNMKKF